MPRFGLVIGAAALAATFLTPVTTAFAQPAGAKARPAAAGKARTPGASKARPPQSVTRPKKPQGATRPAPNRPNRGGNNITAGNTVVVAPGRPSNGYYDNGNYHPPRDWDDDDDDFLEFVGKTAAITAGASAVTAVIGAVVDSKPKDPGCQEIVSNGQTYLNCNGTWYQAVPPAGAQQAQPQYQVVAPPQ
ncbi:hypothetical protein L6Q21_11480 [Sandaracinobacter sp. RS1-74]|uniref:hypothetical protein n=1 Tax=Sandaracinobacteroides sayramensis TaxID=2913411 RepID=UPI001EDA5BEA|nr:hypothetical protein [Sandaracinobacteroides sayramensis]MCG2841602.1 hypothetical protein [Sandaracinobacteroides sayramensis]